MTWETGMEPTSPAYSFAANTAERLRTVAGPGTGKSFALRRRIARLLEEGNNPQRILAVTFTRTAAADLKSEIQALEIEGADQVVARTLHSLCFKILEQEQVFNNLQRHPRPLLEHEIDPLLRDLSYAGYGNVRDKRKRIRDYEAAWARLQRDDPGFALNELDQRFERDLIAWLKYHHAILIGDLIPLTLQYLRNNPLCQERRMFDHVLVDEYQDLNKAEQVLVDLLTGNGSCTIIGDDDQSIYSFRNAHPEGIRTYPDDKPQCVSINFDECRRCPSNVVVMASQLIANNTNRTLGALAPFQGNNAGSVQVLQWATLEDEVNGITRIVQKLVHNDNVAPGDILILAPRRRIGYRIRNSISQQGIDIRSYFREQALESIAAKHLFSLLTFAGDPDDRVSLRYLIGEGSSSFLQISYVKIKSAAEEREISPRELLDLAVGGEVNIPGTSSILNRYRDILTEMRVIKELLNRSSQELINTITPEENEELETLRDAVLAAQEIVGEFNSPGDEQSWINSIVQETRNLISMPETPDEVDHIRVMSLHSSKGLSSKVVIITSCIEGLIPVHDYDLSAEEQARQLEEQRRLFYVGITRCKTEPNVYSGTLILSSFVTMPYGQALQLGLNVNRRFLTTRFITELGGSCPQAMSGADYLLTLGE
ncbi:MAG: ATP-dependent helicase [Syntrophomonadaceae bacterium]|nr:ATP-dependent helicase [Syntrophomonadaceae bacterium]